MFQSAIKAINNLPSPKYDSRLSREEQQRYEEQVTHLIWVAIDIPSVFSGWAQEDEFGAVLLAQGIKNQGIRAAATLGICTGLLKIDKQAGKTSTIQKD